MNNIPRPDDPHAVMLHKDRFYGGRALVILGGPSAGSGAWERLRDELRPDVLLTCNGATDIPGADYWLIAENMKHSAGDMAAGKERARKFMRMFTDPNTAETKLVSYLSWSLLDLYGIDKSNCICIRRLGDAHHITGALPADFSLRDYGEGFLNGPLFSRRDAVNRRVQYHVGTVALHLIHLAGILGCAEVHSIGYDLCFPNGRFGAHHQYDHPRYEPDKFRNEKMFTNYKGLDTMFDWLEAAEFIGTIQPLFEQAGLEWRDHSGGLLDRMKVWCAK